MNYFFFKYGKWDGAQGKNTKVYPIKISPKLIVNYIDTNYEGKNGNYKKNPLPMRVSWVVTTA
ncbi:MAG: hypothetical protein CFE21_01845 [Bacteroidetes bacterium B1(2017)]|nr:MAG: hypothetical protein CFE21_01845 [Bacteroidetes bacterium B1(2017)]